MLDTHRLRVFSSVVASGSVQAAAANLGYTPSAVSQHVTALQRETGLALFERSGRGLRVTAAGLVLAEQADAVLARIGEAEMVVGDLRAGRTGTLSLSYFASVGAAWLPRVVHRLTGEFPGVRLDLALREWLPDDPADRSDVQIAVERADYAAWPGFTVHHLLDDPYVVVLPDTHPLAGRDEVELVELAGERWVDNDFARGRCRLTLVEACTAAGFRPPFHVEAHDYPAAIAFVAAGVGITVLPALGAARLEPGTCAVPVVRPSPVRSILAVVRDAAAHTPPVRAVLEELHGVARPGVIPAAAP
ncbi:LysR family transcriptional regulator [Pseudonocardia nematodicida]|uniref:LysR family transcriptional regulator n=1 Tax=Pseudonocardia nematodicida TaxID=1206997 RepID=A0ABV1KKJ8_9PSEU